MVASSIRADGLELSVVVPVHNEQGAAALLASEIARRLDGYAYEMLFVDDASTDGTRAELIAARAALPALRVLAHRRNAGQSRAVRTGVLAARGRIIALLDGDGQNDPGDLPGLIARLTRPDAPEALGMVGGKRGKRADPWHKQAASRIGNAARAFILRDGATDSGSGIKVLWREAFLRLPYFDHMHRYMPALMQREGYVVEFQEVNHRPRLVGRSKYTNFGRLAVAFADLQGVGWLIRRNRPIGGVDEV
jgi:dolichol-phosphate mannosyltransferase